MFIPVVSVKRCAKKCSEHPCSISTPAASFHKEKKLFHLLAAQRRQSFRGKLKTTFAKQKQKQNRPRAPLWSEKDLAQHRVVKVQKSPPPTERKCLNKHANGRQLETLAGGLGRGLVFARASGDYV